MADGDCGAGDLGQRAADVGGVADEAEFLVIVVNTMGGGDEPVGGDARGAAVATGDRAVGLGRAGLEFHDAGEAGEAGGEAVDGFRRGEGLGLFLCAGNCSNCWGWRAAGGAAAAGGIERGEGDFGHLDGKRHTADGFGLQGGFIGRFGGTRGDFRVRSGVVRCDFRVRCGGTRRCFGHHFD